MTWVDLRDGLTDEGLDQLVWGITGTKGGRGSSKRPGRKKPPALYYLGASQYEQAKYRAAAETFRKAVALRGDAPLLLGWLGGTLHELAEWARRKL